MRELRVHEGLFLEYQIVICENQVRTLVLVPDVPTLVKADHQTILLCEDRELRGISKMNLECRSVIL